MADKAIGDLTSATSIYRSDLFLLQQANTAKKLSGDALIKWLLQQLDGHGGIQNLEKTATDGLIDTYTVTTSDGTKYTFTVKNGNRGPKGDPGATPHIGENGNWYVENNDTGVPASGIDGSTPRIGENGNWFIDEVDTGAPARGTSGESPSIGQNGNWYIGGHDTGYSSRGEKGQAGIYYGLEEPADPSHPVWISPNGGIDVGEILLRAHPIGSYYQSDVETSPASIFGGTWERIKDKFILAAGDFYPAGSTGGESSHTLTVNEMPSHQHDLIASPDTYPNDFHVKVGDWEGNTNFAFSRRGPIDDWNVIAGPTGGGQPHNNMPPYLAVYMWKRIA